MSVEHEFLLRPQDPPAFTLINPEGASSLLLVCDHASFQLPAKLQDLGLSHAQLSSHIGWDPGAAQVAQLLAQQLDAPLVMSGYSRLVIDCNRPLPSAELIPESSAGQVIPGNLRLSCAEKAVRIRDIFWPYHQAIDDLIESRLQLPNRTPITQLLSIHSFTPQLQGQWRPWSIGIAAYQDERFARALYQALAAPGDISVGFNQPYAIDAAFDYTLPVQGEGCGLHSAMVEIRQDGLKKPEDICAWASRIDQAFRQIDLGVFI